MQWELLNIVSNSVKAIKSNSNKKKTFHYPHPPPILSVPPTSPPLFLTSYHTLPSTHFFLVYYLTTLAHPHYLYLWFLYSLTSFKQPSLLTSPSVSILLTTTPNPRPTPSQKRRISPASSHTPHPATSTDEQQVQVEVV